MNTATLETLLGGLSAQQFLDEYWQQKPLLVRQAFPDFQTPISPEEFAGLSCDTDAPSRILAEKGLKTPWQALYGPFDDETFASLPETHWTLLINDVDRYYPELRDEIIEPFRFIPDWRIDDLMISFAVEGGSVGPHTDEYDVFLLQAHGQRRWQIADHTYTDDDLIPNIDLRILKDFNSEQEWVLNPGDMLYLPPNIIHHGVAVNDCMTYSVGFRAPSQQDLLSAYIEECTSQPSAKKRYHDSKRSLQQSSGEIDRNSMDNLTQLLKSGLQDDPKFVDQIIGKYLTDIKGDTPEQPTIEERYTLGKAYQRASTSRFAYVIYPDKVNFFANGLSNIYSAKFVESAKFLCEHYHYDAKRLKAHMEEPEFAEIFTILLKNQAIYSQQDNNETL